MTGKKMKVSNKNQKINLKMTISYDGTHYAGWQRLGKESRKKTIQGTLEAALQKVFLNDAGRKEKYEVTGSGRTDIGVHAKGQVANVFVLQKELERYHSLGDVKKQLNQMLPCDIKVVRLETAENTFHSRYSAVGKVYEYRIDTREKPDVFMRKYALSFPKPLDLDKMKAGAQYFVGTHDFFAFSSNMPDGRGTVCNIEWIQIERDQNFVLIRMKGDGFLYHMVRLMTGTLLLVGTGAKKPEDVKKILESRERSRVGMMAEGKGLCLCEVCY